MATTNSIPMPVGEMVVFLLSLLVLIAVVTFLIVRSRRRRFGRGPTGGV